MTHPAKSWQSRLTQQQDPLAVDFVQSISIDQRLADYDIAGSVAHAQMLSENGLIKKSEFQKIKKALIEIANFIQSGKFKFDPKYEDIHMVIEAELIQKIGDIGKKLHTGRSRNDQVVLDFRLWMRDEIVHLSSLIESLQKVFISLAKRQGQIVIPGYTHLQRAQPVLLGSYLLAFVEQLQRDKLRFRETFDRVNVCPLGSGAMAGSTLPLDRKRVAELLGFKKITRNSIDSVSDRDFCADFVYASAMTTMHLSRLSEDWIIYSSTEFGLVRIDDAYSTGSSMMPQKRNPDMLELIRGKSGQIYGNLIALLTMLKGLPMTYNRDMQEDKKQVFDAADTLRACLEIAAAIVGHTAFDKDRIGRDIDRGFLDATSLAEYLVRQGVPFRQAHQIVGKLVQQCETKNITLAELELSQLKTACDKIEKDVYQHLTAEKVAGQYVTEGAAGQKQLKQQLAFWEKEFH